MYELFVLGELMAGDKHGYVLQEIVKNAGGPYRQFSSGTLYPLLNRLGENGLITLRIEEEQEGGRPRKIFSLTEAGRERFLELMAKPLEYNAETQMIFRFKMVYFNYVAKDIRIACLEQYLYFIQHKFNHVKDFEAKIIAHKPSPEKERSQLLRVFDYRKHLAAADIEWVNAEIERVKAAEE